MGLVQRFLDFFTRPAQTTTAIDEPVGTGGTVLVGGFVQEPEKLANLRSPQRFQTFANDALNNAVVGLGIRYFLTLTKRANWQVHPDPELPTHKYAEEGSLLIRRSMRSMDKPWSKVVAMAAMSRFFGYSLGEWIAKRFEDGFIGMQTVEKRPQSTIARWDIEPGTGRIIGVEQWSPLTAEPIYIPRSRLVYACDDDLADSPLGTGILRHAQEDLRVMKEFEKFEGIGFETDMKGIPVGRAPLALLAREIKARNISAADRDELIEALQDILENHVKNSKMGILLDSAPYTSPDGQPSNVMQWGVELMRGESGATAPIHTAILRREMRIARLFNVQHLLVGANDRGSFAMVKSAAKDLSETIMAFLQEIAAVLMQDYGRPVLRNNGLPEDMPIVMMPDPVSQLDVLEMTTALLQMSQAGAPILPGDPAVDKVRERVQLPPVPKELADEALEMTRMEAEPKPAAPAKNFKE